MSRLLFAACFALGLSLGLSLAPGAAPAATLPGLATLGQAVPAYVEKAHRRGIWHCHRAGARRWCHR